MKTITYLAGILAIAALLWAFSSNDAPPQKTETDKSAEVGAVNPGAGSSTPTRTVFDSGATSEADEEVAGPDTGDSAPKSAEAAAIEQPWDVTYELVRGVDPRVEGFYDWLATGLEGQFPMATQNGTKPYDPGYWEIRAEKLATMALIRDSRFLYIGDGDVALPTATADTVYRSYHFGGFTAAFEYHRSEFPEMFMTREELKQGPIQMEFAARQQRIQNADGTAGSGR